jgi:hypothetical protein
MSLPFKYTASFANNLKVVEVQDQFVSEASLDELSELLPKDIDFEKNIDLIGVAFNAAVANMFNKNGDGIDARTAVAIKDYFIHKPANIEHDRQKVVGHIVGASLSSFEDSKIIEEADAAKESGPFNIALSAVVYRSVNSDFAELVEKSADKDSEFYQKVSASWEIGFNDYDIAVGSTNLSESRIVSSAEEKEELKSCLKCYGGNGRTETGESVHRLIKGDIYPLGIGFTTNPAAAVKGLITEEQSDNQDSEESSESYEFEKISIEDQKNNKKISQIEKHDVNSYNIQNQKHIMEKEILDKLQNVIEATASSKQLSEEAVANMTKIFHDAIVEKSKQWESQKEELQNEKADLESAAQTAQQSADEVKSQLEDTVKELDELKARVADKEALELFHSRMEDLDQTFELDDEDRSAIVDDIKSLDSTEEAFAGFKHKLSVLWKQKTKSFREEQEKALQEKIEAAVQERLATSEKSEASEKSEEQVVEEAIENAEVEKEAVANNNGSSAEEELSLREKFKQAFSEDSITIQY